MKPNLAVNASSGPGQSVGGMFFLMAGSINYFLISGGVNNFFLSGN